MERRPGARSENIVIYRESGCEVVLCMECGCEAKHKGGVERVLL